MQNMSFKPFKNCVTGINFRNIVPDVLGQDDNYNGSSRSLFFMHTSEIKVKLCASIKEKRKKRSYCQQNAMALLKFDIMHFCERFILTINYQVDANLLEDYSGVRTHMLKKKV